MMLNRERCYRDGKAMRWKKVIREGTADLDYAGLGKGKLTSGREGRKEGKTGANRELGDAPPFPRCIGNKWP